MIHLQPGDASIVIFFVGIIFGIGISFQKIADHERRIRSLEQRPLPDTQIAVLQANHQNMEEKLDRIITAFESIQESIDAHFEALVKALNAGEKKSGRGIGGF